MKKNDVSIDDKWVNMFCRPSNIVALQSENHSQYFSNILKWQRTTCFLCNNISTLHKAVCVSSRIEFSPSGPMKRSTGQPPTGWTVVIAWYALIQHLLGLFYSPVRAVFTASALSTAYTSIKYCKAGIHQDLFSHCVIDFFLFKQETSVFLSS